MPRFANGKRVLDAYAIVGDSWATRQYDFVYNVTQKNDRGDLMRKNGKKTLTNTRTLTRRAMSTRRRVSTAKQGRLVLGRYIVADPKICHGVPTFRGTRIFVSDVLEMVAAGTDWDTIIEEWHDHITKEAIAEAVKLASVAFFKHTEEFVLETMPA